MDVDAVAVATTTKRPTAQAAESDEHRRTAQALQPTASPAISHRRMPTRLGQRSGMSPD